MRYHVIGDEDTVLGFGLVGVGGQVVSDAAEAGSAFSRALADPENAIIIMTERVADMIRATVDRFIFTEEFPLIVEIADREGPIPGRSGLRRLVNEAIGISV